MAGSIQKKNGRYYVVLPFGRKRKPEIRFHDLRHTYAALLIAQGGNPKYIQRQLGHASIQMTFDLYGHLMPEVRQEAPRRLEMQVFGNNG